MAHAMPATEPGASSDSVESSGTRPASPGGTAERGRSRTVSLALSAVVVAGLVAGLLGEVTHELFQPRLQRFQYGPIPGVDAPSLETQRIADTNNAALVMGIQGAVLALAMGLAGGLASRSPIRGAAVGLGAMVAGGAAGASATLAMLPILFRSLVPNPNDLLTLVLVETAIWSAIGAVAGLAMAMGFWRIRRLPIAVLQGAIAAIVAAIVHRLLCALISPASAPTTFLPDDATSRLLGVGLLFLFVAIGTAGGMLDTGPTRDPAGEGAHGARCRFGLHPDGSLARSEPRARGHRAEQRSELLQVGRSDSPDREFLLDDRADRRAEPFQGRPTGGIVPDVATLLGVVGEVVEFLRPAAVQEVMVPGLEHRDGEPALVRPAAALGEDHLGDIDLGIRG